MGGRKEVLGIPAVESLGYMDMEMKNDEAEAEKERARHWLQFLIHTFTAPSLGKEDPQFLKNKQEFIEVLKPVPKKEPTKIYDWDEELMKRLIAQQEGG